MATPDDQSPDSSADPWTPDQESALLKALIQYKPVGLHAHFRMLSIRNTLLTSGTIDPEAPHTRIPGIWTKLKTLYDLDQLNDREDEVFTSLGEDENDNETNDNAQDDAPKSKRSKSSAETKTTLQTGYWRDFELPTGADDADDFEALMWERRLDPDGTSDGSNSDEEQRRGGGAGGGETTDEPRSSPVGRGTRSSRKGRINKLKDEMEIDSPTSNRGSRRTSKAASEVEGTGGEDHTMEDADDDNEEDNEDEDDRSETQDDDEEDEKRGTAKRGRGGGGRGRGKRGRKRK